MSINNPNHKQMGFCVGGLPGGPLDPQLTGSYFVRTITDGSSPITNHCFIPRDHAPNATGQNSFDGMVDPGTSGEFELAYPGLGSMHGTYRSCHSEFFMGGTPTGAGFDLTAFHTTNPANAYNPSNQPLQETYLPGPPQETTREGGVKVIDVLQQLPYVPDQVRKNLPHWGEFKIDPWEEKKGVPTAETPSAASMGMGMLANLPGMIMSLAQSFKGLSNQQKQAIRANTGNDIYSVIETSLTNAYDVGDIQTISIGNRVHKETFANNLVDVLCKCQTYADVVDAMWEMRSNTARHGKDKIPVVEFPNESIFGQMGIKIDAYGNMDLNISSQFANSYAELSDLVATEVENQDIIATFYGEVIANTLSVNIITYGTIKIGSQYFIEGEGVAANTYIIKGITGSGNTGTYIVSLNGQTPHPNTPMLMYTVTPPKSNTGGNAGGGGGGPGGLGGGIPGMNMFGDASQLINQIIPVLDKPAATAVKKVLQDIQGPGTPEQQQMYKPHWENRYTTLWT